MRTLVLLTRGSQLALAQTRTAAETLAKYGFGTEIRTVTTHGDQDATTPLSHMGGFGAFVKALEEDLLAGRGDIAVHSLKDVPSRLPAELALAALLPRVSPWDVLVSRNSPSLEDLPAGAVVGTSSLRRRAQLLRIRPDLRVVPFRGNIDTRFRKLREGEVDAAIFAEAALIRLNIECNATRLPFLPAPGQGAVALEAHCFDPLFPAISALDDKPTRLAISAERAFLTELGVGCALPVAAHAHFENGRLRVEGELLSHEGHERVSAVREAQATTPEDAQRLGRELWTCLANEPLARHLREEALQWEKRGEIE